jgi:hypothetical protein
MSRTVKLEIISAVVFILVILLGFAPWYSNRFSYWVQKSIIGWSPWPYPENYTGTIRYYDKYMRMVYSEDLVKGKKQGHLITYKEDGVVQLDEEWKDGHPWNGLCHFWEDKAWVARYKNGKIWDGCMRTHRNAENTCEYFVNGESVSEEIYRSHFSIPPNANLCLGLGYFNL